MNKSVLRVAVWDGVSGDLCLLMDLLCEFMRGKAYLEFCVDRFDSYDKFLDALRFERDYDLFLLGDRVLSEVCLGLCLEIRRFSVGEIVVFGDCCNETALEAFSLGVSRLFSKPLDRGLFFDFLDGFLDGLDLSPARSFVVKSKEGLFRIPFFRTLYVDTRNHVVFYHLVDGRVIASMTIRDSFDLYVLPFIDDERFLRCHYSFVVNLDHVKGFSGKLIRMANDELLPISNSKVEETRLRCFAMV